jgi:GTP1/Obg family GTP-binding protein
VERNKVILDAALPNVGKLSFLKLGAADGVVAEFSFAGGNAGGCYPWIAGLVGADPVLAPPGYRFRLRIELERIDARPATDRAVATARDSLRGQLHRIGARANEIDDLLSSFDGLIRAQVARSMQIHCDADHTK